MQFPSWIGLGAGKSSLETRQMKQSISRATYTSEGLEVDSKVSGRR